MSTKILIIEDDSIIAGDMADRLREAGFEITGQVDNGKDAIESVKNNPPELIIADIEISGPLNGIETAKRLRAIDNFAILFLTNFHDTETMRLSMEVPNSTFMAKPYNDHQIAVNINYALLQRQVLKSGGIYPEDIMIRKNDSYDRYKLQNIIYLEADGVYCYLYPVGAQKIHQTGSMKKHLEKIQHPDFIQIHRSYVVNKDHIKSVRGNMLIMSNDHELKISSTYKKDIAKALGLNSRRVFRKFLYSFGKSRGGINIQNNSFGQ